MDSELIYNGLSALPYGSTAGVLLISPTPVSADAGATLLRMFHPGPLKGNPNPESHVSEERQQLFCGAWSGSFFRWQRSYIIRQNLSRL